VRERDPAGEILVDEEGNVVAVNPSVVDAVGQADGVGGEAVAADVSALPGRLRAELLAETLEERTAVARAARIVLPVRAGEEEWLVDLGGCSPGVEPAELLVMCDVEPAETLLTLAGVGDVDGQCRVMPAVGPPDQQEARARMDRPKLPQARFDLIREAAPDERVGAPEPAVLDEQPAVDPACRRTERLVVLARDVGTEGSGWAHSLSTTQMTCPVLTD
jgi:hypothetical protein